MAKKKEGPINLTKRCPECMKYVSLETKKCPTCKTKLGKVQPHGFAKRTVDWTGYTIAIIAILAFGIYLYWAFMIDK